MEAILKVSIFLLLPFIAFAIYFFFKCLQFVVQAISLHKKMVIRQDATIKLLVDIRDNTKQYDLEALSVEDETALSKPESTPRPIYSEENLRPLEEAKKDAIKEELAAKYESSRKPIVDELKGTLETKNKREILEGLSQLDYYELTELDENPDQLTGTVSVVCRALVDKIKQTIGEGEKTGTRSGY